MTVEINWQGAVRRINRNHVGKRHPNRYKVIYKVQKLHIPLRVETDEIRDSHPFSCFFFLLTHEQAGWNNHHLHWGKGWNIFMVIKIDLKSLDWLCGRTLSSKCTMFQSRNTDFDSYAVSGRSYGYIFGQQIIPTTHSHNYSQDNSAENMLNIHVLFALILNIYILGSHKVTLKLALHLKFALIRLVKPPEVVGPLRCFPIWQWHFWC